MLSTSQAFIPESHCSRWTLRCLDLSYESLFRLLTFHQINPSIIFYSSLFLFLFSSHIFLPPLFLVRSRSSLSLFFYRLPASYPLFLQPPKIQWDFELISIQLFLLLPLFLLVFEFVLQYSFLTSSYAPKSTQNFTLATLQFVDCVRVHRVVNSQWGQAHEVRTSRYHLQFSMHSSSSIPPVSGICRAKYKNKCEGTTDMNNLNKDTRSGKGGFQWSQSKGDGKGDGYLQCLRSPSPNIWPGRFGRRWWKTKLLNIMKGRTEKLRSRESGWVVLLFICHFISSRSLVVSSLDTYLVSWRRLRQRYADQIEHGLSLERRHG